jgi:hypothetical protein
MVKGPRKLAWLVLFATLTAGANAQTANRRTAISQRRVAGAITSAGVPVKAAQVEFLSEVSAAEDVSLRIVSVNTWTDGTAKVRLRCRDNRECLPFYVLLRDAQTLGVRHVYQSPVRVATDKSRAEKALSPRLVRGGDRATLILESSDLRINMSVICLESGTRGQQIRVASSDGRRFYKGEVVEEGVLKGNL